MPDWSFTEHPRSIGESYFEHLCSAWHFSRYMLLGSLACFIHGLFPFLFVRTGSSMITALHDRMVVNRSRSAKQRKRCAGEAATRIR
jgi:hypothetical protein